MPKIILLFLVLLNACSQQETASLPFTPQIAKVKTLMLSPQSWQDRIDVYGVVEAAEEIHLSVNFSEPVNAVLFKEGQQVIPGQVLIKLDTQKRHLRVQRAKNAVNAAKATLEKSTNELHRRRKLAKLNVLSTEALQTAEILQLRLSARHQEALALLNLAKRELRDSTLVSPSKGIIDKRLIEPGETTQAGQTLVVIQAIDSVRIKTFVSEKDVNYLLQGDTAAVSFPALRGKQHTALIESIGVKADKRTGNFPIYLSLANNNGLLRSGMTAHVQLLGLRLSDSLLIPDTAIVDRKRKKVVYLFKNNKAKLVQPLLRASMSAWVPVLEGLKAGDQIIIEGLENIQEGSLVKIEVD
ncbi:MAG: efflux RND transporter periplasmic adaptor subunit [Methyloprofundus sp.]|nr:efflux RND transporter periplasmic adaptor subunit [Methyloprofundus sp.]